MAEGESDGQVDKKPWGMLVLFGEVRSYEVACWCFHWKLRVHLSHSCDEGGSVSHLGILFGSVSKQRYCVNFPYST